MADSSHSPPASRINASPPSNISGSDSRNESGYGGSDSDNGSAPMSCSADSSDTSNPSIGNNPLPFGDSSSASLRSIYTSDVELALAEGMELDTATTETQPPVKQNVEDMAAATEPQPEVKQNVKDVGSTSRSKRSRMAEEIGLLTNLYQYKNKQGRYASSRSNVDMEEFYWFWVERLRAYATREDLDNKLNELFERFKYYKNKNVEAPTDPDEIEIFRHSSWVWDDEVDSNEEIGADEDDQNNDSGKQETGDDHIDTKDSKDPAEIDPKGKKKL